MQSGHHHSHPQHSHHLGGAGGGGVSGATGGSGVVGGGGGGPVAGGGSNQHIATVQHQAARSTTPGSKVGGSATSTTHGMNASSPPPQQQQQHGSGNRGNGIGGGGRVPPQHVSQQLSRSTPSSQPASGGHNRVVGSGVASVGGTGSGGQSTGSQSQQRRPGVPSSGAGHPPMRSHPAPTRRVSGSTGTGSARTGGSAPPSSASKAHQQYQSTHHHSRSYPRGVGIDFRKLATQTLYSYVDHHGVSVRPEAPPSELAVAVARHFESMEVDEEAVIGGFLARLESGAGFGSTGGYGPFLLPAGVIPPQLPSAHLATAVPTKVAKSRGDDGNTDQPDDDDDEELPNPKKPRTGDHAGRRDIPLSSTSSAVQSTPNSGSSPMATSGNSGNNNASTRSGTSFDSWLTWKGPSESFNYLRSTAFFDGKAPSPERRKRRRARNAARQGEQVAAKVKSADENGSWILASVTRFYPDTEKYDVQDEDDTSNLNRLPWNHVMRLSTGAEGCFKKGTQVMAIFPETTSFYRAVVSRQPVWKIQTPPDEKTAAGGSGSGGGTSGSSSAPSSSSQSNSQVPPATYMTPMVKEIIVKFEDDENENGRTPHRRVPSRYVIPLPSVYFHDDDYDDIDLNPPQSQTHHAHASEVEAAAAAAAADAAAAASAAAAAAASGVAPAAGAVAPDLATTTSSSMP